MNAETARPLIGQLCRNGRTVFYAYVRELPVMEQTVVPTPEGLFGGCVFVANYPDGFYVESLDERSVLSVLTSPNVSEVTERPALYVERAKTDVMALDLGKLFPAAGTVDSWAQSLPTDVVADVLQDLGKGAQSANVGK